MTTPDVIANPAYSPGALLSAVRAAGFSTDGGTYGRVDAVLSWAACVALAVDEGGQRDPEMVALTALDDRGPLFWDDLLLFDALGGTHSPAGVAWSCDGAANLGDAVFDWLTRASTVLATEFRRLAATARWR